ncbi:MAG: hypothetical protein EOO73_03095 [Myxococcales bacterium]|nr:MAG: hypothetical protein EOO73_03095 [Myxococcales bacterium]
MRAARRKPSFGTAQLALLLAAGCSLQDFDYLQKGTGGSNAGGTSSSAGTSAAGTESGQGGEGAEPSTAGTGGAEPSAGTKSGGSNSGGTGNNAGTGGGGGKGGTGGTGGGGTGATGELLNGSFETNSTMGWTVDPAKALANPPRYAFVQPPTSGATVPDGGYEFSTWHMVDAFKVDLYQTIEGVKDGTYVFKGYFNLGSGHNRVELYATNCGGKDPTPTAVLPAGDAVWSPVLLEGIEVKGGSCTVGLYIDSNKLNWLNADLFTFELDPNASPGGEGGAGGDTGAGGAN